MRAATARAYDGRIAFADLCDDDTPGRVDDREDDACGIDDRSKRCPRERPRARDGRLLHLRGGDGDILRPRPRA